MTVCTALMNFFFSNHGFFQTNSPYTILKLGKKHHLHRPNAELSSFPKSTVYDGTKHFNSLSPTLTMPKNGKAQFIAAFTKQLTTHCFYGVDDLLMCKDDL